MRPGMRELLSEKVCPRCGEHFTYLEERTVGNNTYLLCVHVKKHGKKRTVKKCYLGPKEAYIYANTFNKPIIRVRSPLADQLADIRYALEILSHIKGTNKLTERQKKAIKTIETALKRAEERAKREKVEEEE